jgi:hypothetical protein
MKIELETYSSFCNSGLCPRLKFRLLENDGRKAAARVGRRAATAERVRARRAIEHDLEVKMNAPMSEACFSDCMHFYNALIKIKDNSGRRVHVYSAWNSNTFVSFIQ